MQIPESGGFVLKSSNQMPITYLAPIHKLQMHPAGDIYLYHKVAKPA